MDYSTYDDLSEFDSAQQQPQLESFRVVDCRSFVNENIPNVIDDHSTYTKRKKQNGYAKKYRMKKIAEEKQKDKELDDLMELNKKFKELKRVKIVQITSTLDTIIDMTLIDDPADFCKALKDANLHHSHKYTILKLNIPEEDKS
jgi:hypothetical protein